jgi:hypothetical protein
MDTEAAARRWAEAWAAAWPAKDVEAIVALYADDAVFLSHPFRDHQRVPQYVEWAFADQADAVCRFGRPLVGGERAAVDWWAVVTATDGSTETLAGTSLLRFRRDGRVVEQRDVWASTPGRPELPAWARS